MFDFFDSLRFEHPYFLALPLLFLVCARFCRARDEALVFPHLHIFVKTNQKREVLESILKWLIVFCASIALAAPVTVDSFEKSRGYGYDIALALDASGSMGERGFDAQNSGKDKFSIAKDVALKFIQSRKNDNIAVTVFGEYAFIAAPLTFDKRLLGEIVGRFSIGMAGEKTAINDALAQMARSLEKSRARSKIGILLTDGMNTAGRIPQKVASAMIEKNGITLYTVGFGRTHEIDTRLLNAIAQESGGRYFHAQNREVLEQVYEIIDSLEKSDIESSKIEKKEHHFIYPLFTAILALLFYIYLKNRRGV